MKIELFRMHRLQISALTIGTLFAWYTVATDYIFFYQIEGTVFRVRDCVVPNPVTTPCFWGAWAFVIALGAALYIRRQSQTLQKKYQTWLAWFLVGGVLFAWSNFGYGFLKFIQNQGEPTIGCSGRIMTNPFTTPCFHGALFFLVACMVGILLAFHLHRLTRSEN